MNYIGKEIYFKIPIDVKNNIVSQCAQFFKLIKHLKIKLVFPIVNDCCLPGVNSRDLLNLLTRLMNTRE